MTIHDHQLTLELDPSNQRLLTPSPVAEMCALPTLLIVAAVFKDIALKEQCDVETIQTVYMTKTS